jgi:hypothetical protein
VAVAAAAAIKVDICELRYLVEAFALGLGRRRPAASGAGPPEVPGPAPDGTNLGLRDRIDKLNFAPSVIERTFPEGPGRETLVLPMNVF